MLWIAGDFLFIFMYAVIRYRRKIVFQNLRVSFPEKSLKEITRIEKSFYRHFSDLMIESLKNFDGDGKSIIQRIQFKNLELIQQLYLQQKSIVLNTAHYGNWEWLAFLPFSVPHKVIAFYQPFSNSLFDDLMKKSRKRHGVLPVSSRQAYKTLKSFNDRGELVLSIVLSDQSPPPDSPKVWLNFLGRETAYLVGAGKIAKKLGHVVVYPHFIKISRSNYQIEFKMIPPDEDVTSEHPYIRGYSQLLEQSILNDPGLWLWSHRRWKLKK